MWRMAGPGDRSEIAVELRGVSRRFRLHHETRTSFQDWFVGLLRPRGKGEEFWALRDVSFTLRRGVKTCWKATSGSTRPLATVIDPCPAT